MMPALQDSALDSLPDAAESAYAIDGTQVMLVPGFNDVATIKTNSQAGAEHRLLDIVRCQRIAGEQHVDVAGSNQTTEVFAAARVHDGGASDNKRFLTAVPHFAKFVGDLGEWPPPWAFRWKQHYS